MSGKHKLPTILAMIGLGLGSGALGGLLGIGGGALIVPGLVFLLNHDQHRAHGTSLVIVLMSCVSAVATYAYYGLVDLKVVAAMATGGAIGALCGAKAANAIKGPALRRIFCLFLIFVGVQMIRGACFGGAKPPDSHHLIIFDNPVLGIAKLLATGLVAGFASSLFGVGGGMVMVPAMTCLLFVPQQLAQGVSKTSILVTSSTGALAYRRFGNVDARAAMWGGAGGIVGAWIGAIAAANVGSVLLKLIFGVFVIVMSVALALKKDGEKAKEVSLGDE